MYMYAYVRCEMEMALFTVAAVALWHALWNQNQPNLDADTTTLMFSLFTVRRESEAFQISGKHMMCNEAVHRPTRSCHRAPRQTVL
jgi:hypothetical protein